MKYTVEFQPKARKSFLKLGKNVQQQIYDYFENHLKDGVDPTSFGKPLQYNKRGLWRYRVGNFRIICQIQHDRLVVLVIDIDTRDKVYESVEKWNKDAGYYTQDGSYKPKIDTKTGAIILPIEIYDMWD